MMKVVLWRRLSGLYCKLALGEFIHLLFKSTVTRQIWSLKSTKCVSRVTTVGCEHIIQKEVTLCKTFFAAHMARLTTS